MPLRAPLGDPGSEERRGATARSSEVGYALPSPGISSFARCPISTPKEASTTRATGTSCWPGSLTTEREADCAEGPWRKTWTAMRGVYRHNARAKSR